MNDELLLRYSRQILLPQVDLHGQERLQTSKVLIIGMGGLGSPVTLYLAAAGIGHLTLVDFDMVELSNLQRQIIHNQQRIGHNKAHSAAQSTHAINPHVNIDTIQHRLDSKDLQHTVAQHDVIVDCSDNFPTRFALNRACQQAAKPLVSGAVIRMEGQVTSFDFRQVEGACYQCLYGEEGENEDTCSSTGILAPVAGIIGSIQATETLKLLLDLPSLHGRLLVLDALKMQWRELRLQADPNCPICSSRHTIT